MSKFLPSFPRSRNYLLDFLCILFGISAWISVNGLWVELPSLVQVLPEGWNLASYLSVIVQMANLGPLSYTVLILLRGESRECRVLLIYGLLLLGTLASIYLSVSWKVTVHQLLGSERSLHLFIAVFLLSLVDCTSSLLFLPFMNTFKSSYLNSYLIGEGLSGLVPSLAALAQGVSEGPLCINSTLTYPSPRFSVDSFFFFLFFLMGCSLLSFFLLNTLRGLRSEFSSNENLFLAPVSSSSSESPLKTESSTTTTTTSYFSSSSSLSHSFALLLTQSTVCFLSNGALPSIQTYSCLPYGNFVYHLSVSLNALGNPLMAFIAFFCPTSSLFKLGLGTLLGFALSSFLLATALNSPSLLLGPNLGATLTVFSWTLSGCIFSYIKVSIAGLCRNSSTTNLFWCGTVTQLGSALGAITMFILVNIYPIFEATYITCPQESN